MSDREKEPGQIARIAFMKAQNKGLTLDHAWAEAEAAIYEDAAKVADTVEDEYQHGDEIARADGARWVAERIRAKIGGSHG